METSCSVELKVMYARDLKAFNFFQKLNVYVLVSIVNKDPNKESELNKEQRTQADKEGDGDPEWNHEMRFDLNHDWFRDCDHLFLQFSLRHEGVVFGDKTIGEVNVPFKDLIQEYNGIVRFVSYEVRSPDGKPNGILNFSYKVNGNCKDQIGTGSASSQINGYPIVHNHHNHHHHHHDNHSSEVQYPEIHSSSAEKIHYPPLDLEEATVSFAPPQDHGLSPQAQYLSQENYHPTSVLPFPPPPPPPPPSLFLHPLLPPPPPPPPMAQGACYFPPYPPPAYTWGTDPYGYGKHGTHGQF